ADRHRRRTWGSPETMLSAPWGSKSLAGWLPRIRIERSIRQLLNLLATKAQANQILRHSGDCPGPELLPDWGFPVSPAAFIDRHPNLLLAWLRKLVRTSTVNPPGENYDEITAYLTGELALLGFEARRFSIPASVLKRSLPPEQHGYPRYNVLGKLPVPGARKTIHFNAHYDVVPVSGKWRHGSPFSAAVEGGQVYGRGTADMKGSIASLLLAIKALRATGTAPKMNLEVSFTADEETDSLLGAGWLVRHAPIRPDYAIVMEGGEKNSICCGHNGVVWLEVAVHGKAAHGSKPEYGINAFEKMAALTLALGDYKRRLAKHRFVT